MWVRPLFSAQNLNEGSAVLPSAAPYPQRLALVRLLEVVALFDEAGRDPTFAELMLRTPEATDEEFRALITKSRQERPSWRLKE